MLKKYQKVNTKEYDIAIAYYGINNYSDLYAAQAKAKEKLIWVHCNFNDLYQASNHKFLIKIRNKLIAKKFNYFNQIIAVSESAKDGFLKIFPKYKDKISVINNIFSMERLASKNEDSEIEIQGENNLIYIGMALFTILPIIFIILYNGKQGKKIKYFLYLFYPLHLILLYFLF